MKISQITKIGPILSDDQFYLGLSAIILGIILIFFLLFISYGTYLGLIGSIALIYCGILTWGIFNATGLVLDLPGLAGFILTAGVAVDSFILIFEAIKEEIRKRINNNLEPYDEETIWSSIKNTSRLLWTLRMTSLIGSFVLLFFSGPIKGFAITSIVGLIISVIVSSKLIIGGMLLLLQNYGQNVSTITYGLPIFQNQFFEKILKKILSKKNIIWKFSMSFILFSMLFILKFGFNVGNDFTTGTQLQLRFDKSIEKGQIYEGLSEYLTKNKIKLYSVQKVETQGTQFEYLLKLSQIKNLEIQSIISKLNLIGYNVTLDSEKTVSGYVNKQILFIWILAIFISIIILFIYCLLPFARTNIANFYFRPTIFAILAIFHDVIFLLGIISIFRIELSIAVFSGLLFIVGYSITDSLILIYKIREKIKSEINLFDEKNKNIVDETIINIRSRIALTTLATIAGILPIIFINIDFIRPFIITIIFGILIGTFSSTFFVGKFLEEMIIKNADTSIKSEIKKLKPNI